jgi:hypothetical protein
VVVASTGLVAIASSAASAEGAAVAAAPSATLTLDGAARVPTSTLPPVAADKVQAAPRARFVTLDAPRIRQELAAGPVALPLFPDVTVPLVADGPVHPGAGGTLTWSGRAPDGGYATLTFDHGAVRGDVAYGGVRYDLAPVGGGRHLVTVEQRDFPAEQSVVAPLPGPGAASARVAPPDASVHAAANPVIRVLTWYDTAARTFFGGDSAAQSEIAATINEANAAYARSGVNQTIESAGIEYVAYAGGSTANTELNQLTDSTDGTLDAVHARRDATGADLVSLVSNITDACGIAWLPPVTPSAATSDYGFSVIKASCARGNLSYAHELGHNMGAGHGGGNGGGLYSYSNGHLDAAHAFRTIMAYDSGGCCTRVAYFSSATVLYNGFATGSATEDNARTLNQTAAGIAGYRSGGVPPPDNDAFSAAFSWVPANGNPIVGSNEGATKQTGEPDHAGNAGGRSVWWRFTPSVATLVHVTTAGSSFDTLLGVYTGASVGALTTVATNDDAAANTASSQLDFLAAPGTPYSIAVDGYAGATGSIQMTITVSDPTGDWYHPTTPARVQDSRPSGPQVGPYSTPWAAGTTRSVQVAGTAGVPSDATAVTLNVTVTNPTGASYLTVWPTGQSRPLASSLNWTPGRTIANAVTVGVGTGGKISVFNAAGTTDVIIDVVGSFRAGTGATFHPTVPARIQDSRPSGPQVGPYATPWGTATTRVVQAGSNAGVPGNAHAVLLNVTVTNPTGASYLTVWPTGQSRPLASSLNWTPGLTIPNAATVRLGTVGRISVFNAAGSVDVIADVAGWYG